MEIEEILKELNLFERIIVKIFRKTFTKIFNCIRIEIVNNILH